MLADKIDSLKESVRIRTEIENSINRGDYVSAKKALEQYFNDYEYDIQWCMLKAAVFSAEGEYEEAKDILSQKYKQHEWNFDLNYHLGKICCYLNEFAEATRYLVRCLLHEQLTEIAEQQIIEQIEDMCKKDVNVLAYYQQYGEKEEQLISKTSSYFPEKLLETDTEEKAKTFIGDKFRAGECDYYSGIYDRYFEERGGYPLYNTLNRRMLYKTEVLKGVQQTSFSYHAKEDVILALMPLQKSQSITIKNKKMEQCFDKLLENHFYYYSFNKGDIIEIKSAHPFVISGPFIMISNNERPKIIINLQVNALSQEYLDSVGVDVLMPNTYSFFEKGTICKNAFKDSHNIVSARASRFTGKFTLGKEGHRVFHPEYISENLYGLELFPERLQREGYFCAAIESQESASPIAGYAKGMDRILFEPSVIEMFGNDVVVNLVEHIEAFKKCSNFICVTLPDLQDLCNGYESTISTQIRTRLKFRKIPNARTTEESLQLNESEKARYEAMIKQLDITLGMLYSYIESNYQEDEYIISLNSIEGSVSAHTGYGQSFELKENKMVMMFRGCNIPAGNCMEIVAGMDLFPILFYNAGIFYSEKNEGKIPKWFGGRETRKYSLTEHFVPGLPYEAIINTKDDTFFFSTKKPVSKDGYIDLDGSRADLEFKHNESSRTKVRQCLKEEYTDIVLNHIKEYVKIEV